MKKFLRFISWPSIAGILFAVILVQYQQINRLSDTPPAQHSPGEPNAAASPSYADAVGRAAPSVVSIHSTIREHIELPPADELPAAFRELLKNIPSERLWESLGSGVAVTNDGHILTALHVIEGAEDIEVHFEDGSNTIVARARLIGEDPSTDLALLQIDSNITPPQIPMGSSDTLRVGDTVLTIGYPRRDLMNQKSVSSGIVSALGIPRDGLPIVDYIQTDASMTYGNSGGALINAHGELIGINSFIYSHSGNSDGIGFAVPVNKARFVVDQIIRYGEVTPGYLGVITGEMLNQETSIDFFGRDDIQGLLIEHVNTNSPAETAGIQAGDVMTAIDGEAISSVIRAIDQINSKAPGQIVDLRIYRAGQTLTVPVELGTGTAQYRTNLSQ